MIKFLQEEDRAYIENAEIRSRRLIAKHEARKEKTWLKHKYIEEELRRLDVTKAWE